jgi:hypothetical protein
VIVPGAERMPEATVQILDRIAQRGATMIATARLPQRAPGFLATDADHARVRASAQQLFDGTRGELVPDPAAVGAALSRKLQPDVTLSPATPDIGFSHRHTEGAEIYFVANTANVGHRVDAAFRVADMRAEVWDPIAGTTTAATSTPGARGTTTVALDLEPYASRVVVFSRDAKPRPTTTRPSPARFEPIDVSTGWSVSFGAGAAPVVFDQLRSWTDDERTRYYSGSATYTRTVTVPAAAIAGGRVWLDFGEGRATAPERLRSGMQAWLDAPVREAAVVAVNDRPAGSLWCPPYRLDVTDLLRPGINQLHIVVANLAINHMAGHALPNYRLLNLRYGVRFEPQDMDKVHPAPAGLLGPVRLVAGEGR